MSYHVYFDSGTTNSRAYLVEDGRVRDRAVKQVGTVNNVLTGDGETLVRELFGMYRELLSRNGLEDERVDGIYMSGMATSKNGVSEVDYVRLPVDLRGYGESIVYKGNEIFGRSIGFLTGLVGRPEEEGTLENAAEFNNVRGEEIELFGIMKHYESEFRGRRTAVIMPGSHTHVLFTDRERIVGILSCMGGELFSAVSRHTILGASVSEDPESPDSDMIRALKMGYDAVKRYGFNRALYMVRTLDLFTDAAPGQRDFFLEGAVNAGMITGIKNSRYASGLDEICVAGKRVYYEIFGNLAEHEALGIPCVWLEPSQGSFALRGFLELMRASSSQD